MTMADMPAEGPGCDSVITDIEDVSAMALSSEQLADLVGEGGLCVFNWTTRDGRPMGVLVAYVFRDGRFWTTAPAQRKRVSALRARPGSWTHRIASSSRPPFTRSSASTGPSSSTPWAQQRSDGPIRDASQPRIAIGPTRKRCRIRGGGAPTSRADPPHCGRAGPGRGNRSSPS